jgi:hypothetical protein
VYVLRVHGGDTSFIARYLPTGWFDLATHNPVLRSLGRLFPAPELLAPSVLRVQAFLELPFVLTAFATVARHARVNDPHDSPPPPNVRQGAVSNLSLSRSGAGRGRPEPGW